MGDAQERRLRVSWWICCHIQLYRFSSKETGRSIGAYWQNHETKKNKRRSTADIAMAVQSVDWAPENLAALKQIEEFRGARNILAHCVIRRFPEDDAFAFLFKSAEDYREHFGTDPPYGMTMTAVVDRAQLLQMLPEIERLQIWLSTATMQFEDQIEALSKPKV